MRSVITTVTWAAVATAIAILTGPMTSAGADPGDTLEGGCGVNGIVTGGTAYEGVIYVDSVSREASGTPAGATVVCWMQDDGAEKDGTRLITTGRFGQLNAAHISFTTNAGDEVSLCMQVTFVDGSTWTGPDGTNPDCKPVMYIPIPPQARFSTRI